jgi:hypothetical protein
VTSSETVRTVGDTYSHLGDVPHHGADGRSVDRLVRGMAGGDRLGAFAYEAECDKIAHTLLNTFDHGAGRADSAMGAI